MRKGVLIGMAALTLCAAPAAAQEDDFAAFEAEFHAELTPQKVSDPLRGYNRLVFGFNDFVYLRIWEPSAKAYRWVFPQFFRMGVNNAFRNASGGIRFANSLLQFKFKRAGIELSRLVLNTTLGVGGLWDNAERLGIPEPPPEDFGQTLGRWGIPAGPHFVLPLLGPSNLRDSIGMVPDIFGSPFIYFLNTYESTGVRAGDYFNRSSLHIGEYSALKRDALDPYTFFRDAYEMNRKKKVKE